MYGMVFPIARVHGSRKQGVKKGIVPLIITPSDPLEILISADLEVLAPE